MRIMRQLGEEAPESCDVLEARGELKAGVEVYADASGVVKGLDALCVIGTDASTQEEGRLAFVGGEDFPVEFLPIAADGFSFGVEEEIVHCAVEDDCGFQVLLRCNVKGLDD